MTQAQQDKSVIKNKGKSKPKAKDASKDLIVDTAAEVENLSKLKAYKMMNTLKDGVEFSYFKLGGVLAKIQDEAWYADEGIETFRDFVQQELGIGYRKAMYLIEIYVALVESEVSWDKVKDLGWTKLKELAKIITKENVDEWVEIAENLTVLQLQDKIKSIDKGTLESGEDGVGASEEDNPVSTITFKVHKDQREVIDEAIEKAKEEADTDVSSVALDAICMQYLNGGGITESSPQKTLLELMQEAGSEGTLEVFEEAHPDTHIKVKKKKNKE